jgi:hypothetical protein
MKELKIITLVVGVLTISLAISYSAMKIWHKDIPPSVITFPILIFFALFYKKDKKNIDTNSKD